MSTPTSPIDPAGANPAPVTAQGGVQTVRRLTLYLLLFVMVVIAAIGLSGLLARLFDVGRAVVNDDTIGLAQSLAFTFIAGPLAAVVWWLVWRGAAMHRDRSSLAWPIYLALASTVALVVWAGQLFAWAAEGIAGRWMPAELATGIVWALVWLWHVWMWNHSKNSPTRLIGVAPVIASLIGLVLGVGGAVMALGMLLSSTVDALGGIAGSGAVSIGLPWWVPVLQGLVWTVGGGALWWWHWFRVGVHTDRSGFSNVVLVVIAGFGSLALCLFGVATTLFIVLRIFLDPSDPIVVIIQPLGNAIAAALIGAVVFVYHRRAVADRPAPVRSATTLVLAGLTLAVAASGFGVTVNALLAGLASPIVDTGIRPLLFGGISALLVAGPVWWLLWRPGTPASQRVSTPGRRVYLVVIFGVSAVVALITLLVIGFQLFASALDVGSGSSLLDQIRQALGLLAATVLVAVYHFALWRADRAAAPSVARAIEHITLVAGGDTTELAGAIREATGAKVTVLRVAESDTHSSVDAVLAALGGVTAGRVLLISGAGSSPTAEVQVIRLAD